MENNNLVFRGGLCVRYRPGSRGGCRVCEVWEDRFPLGVARKC